MMTFKVKTSIPAARTLLSEGSSDYSQRGPDVPEYPTYRDFGMGAGRRQAAIRHNIHLRRKYPVIQPLSKSRDGKSMLSGVIVAGSPHLAKDDKLEAENSDPEKDVCGRHFLFDKKCERLERTRTVIPPLPRDYNVHRPGNLHPFSLSKELSHSHAVRPFTLGYPERYELATSPAILLPSTLVLNGRNTFSVENCKISRPKVTYPTYSLQIVKDNHKTWIPYLIIVCFWVMCCKWFITKWDKEPEGEIQSYPDPIVGASRSFIHRISELSSLEGETVRQEKLKKMRKPKKPPS